MDPVGACIGPRGQRVSNIVDALGGEKIDIVKLNAEIAQIVAREHALRAAIDQIVAEIEG